MNQSNVIAAYLFIAFVIFITMRGELRTYLGFFVGGGAPSVAPGSPAPKDTGTGNASPGGVSSSDGFGPTDALKTAVEFLPFVL